MRRFIYTIVACLGLHLTNFAAPALAQRQTQAPEEGKTGVEIFKRSSGQTQSAEEDRQKTPAIPYAVALLSTIIVMVIVCTPSRKREVEKR